MNTQHSIPEIVFTQFEDWSRLDLGGRLSIEDHSLGVLEVLTKLGIPFTHHYVDNYAEWEQCEGDETCQRMLSSTTEMTYDRLGKAVIEVRAGGLVK